MRQILLAILLLIPLAACSASAESPARPLVLVLVDELTWSEVAENPRLGGFFGDAASANLSTAQGAQPEDRRMSYLFLGAGARVDTIALPEKLPRSRGSMGSAFTGPASTIRPGAFGKALAEAGKKAAAVGERAALVVMDREGRVPLFYDGSEPLPQLRRALEQGAHLVAVETSRPGELAGAARRAGATVVVISPNAPPGAPNLTPLAISGPQGLLYSPTTRTAGLVSNADVAPTLLSMLGVESRAGLQGRPAAVRPGTAETAPQLGRRIAFVAEGRHRVWSVVAGLLSAALLAGGLWRGRAGLRFGVLALSALPAAALLAAAFPLTSTIPVAVVITILAGALAILARRLSRTVSGALAAVFLTTAGLITADAAAGGALMKLSTLGYNPAYGTRFYGIGNEYAAVVAGSMTMGLGALAQRKEPPVKLLAAAGAAAVLALGLPTMGADVGGSLALGFGLGATLGLLRKDGLAGVALWALGGWALAAALFLASGFLFPDVSHGSRAASGDSGLYGIVLRKLMLSLTTFLKPSLASLLAVFAVLVYAGWRRARGTPLGAGILGASLTALVSGAINDSGLVAALFALLYPALASAAILLRTARDAPDVR